MHEMIKEVSKTLKSGRPETSTVGGLMEKAALEGQLWDRNRKEIDH